MHLNSQLLFDQYIKRFLLSGSKVLEIGPDSIPSTYATRAGVRCASWDTADLRGSAYDSQLTIVFDNQYDFPLDSESYDIIISGQVLEHVKSFWKWLPELRRILKTGGLLIII